MDEKTKSSLVNLDTWKRGLFILLFALISGLVKLIVTVVSIFQFITLLFKGQVNESVLPFAQNLSTYIYQITLFLTFKTDAMPFPFLNFPDGAPTVDIHEDNIEGHTTVEATTQYDEAPVDAADEDTKQAPGPKKDSKDD
jgi:hypothetical protein